jgi:Flp pilus assembly pilin Flp
MIPDIAYQLRCTMDVIRNERGAALVEYSLLIALIALTAIAALRLLGGQISEEFSDINSDIQANT